ncbi:heterokaryon incompatibility protein-domain-containing protein [Tricladium varicosporioides]|nr:heterokaryon incompatibility protein-domain-containing protein [Hymenoscyphus varicosporioides]
MPRSQTKFPAVASIDDQLKKIDYNLESLMRRNIRHLNSGTKSLPPIEYWPGRFIPFNGHDKSPNANAMRAQNRLCEKCLELRSWLQETLKAKQGYYDDIDRFLHLSVFNMRRSSASGCHLCSIFISSVLTCSDIADPFSEDPSEVVAILLQMKYLYGSRLWVQSKNTTSVEFRRSLDDGRTPDTPFQLDISHRISKFSPSCPLSNCTASEEAQEWAKRQLQNCLSTHSVCTTFGGKLEFMPTRLLDVRSIIKDGIVRIVYPSKEELRSRYTSLSYCWGGDQAVKLIKTTHDEFQTGIHCDILQKSIQDAARITLWFGIEYLWVDALCIIQDDLEDWHRESQLMCEVYQNSTLTISAIGAKSSGEGCFATREPLMHLPCRLTEDNAEDEPIVVEPQLVTQKWRKLAFENSPLFKRAWVVQERMLSPRNLCFGELLSWECFECSTTEIGKVFGQRYSNTKSLLPLKQLVEVNFDSELLENSMLEFWTSLMRTYPSTDIAVPSDRPIAVQGIIKYLEILTKQENKFGLWTPYLASEILWKVETPGSNRKVDEDGARQTQCPSWSWLAMDAPVTNTYTDIRRTDIICRAYVAGADLRSSALHERLSLNCRLHITGFLLRATTFTSNTQQFDGFLKFRECTFLPDRQSLNMNREVFFLLVARDPKDKWGYNLATYYGLAICVSEKVKGAYERIGYLQGGVPLYKTTLEEKLEEKEIILV